MAKRRRRKHRRNDDGLEHIGSAIETAAYYKYTTPGERARDRSSAMKWLPWLIGGVIVFWLISRSSAAPAPTHVPQMDPNWAPDLPA